MPTSTNSEHDRPCRQLQSVSPQRVSAQSGVCRRMRSGMAIEELSGRQHFNLDLLKTGEVSRVAGN